MAGNSDIEQTFNYDVKDVGFRSRLLLDASHKHKDFWELCNSYSPESYERMQRKYFLEDSKQEDRKNNSPENVQKEQVENEEKEDPKAPKKSTHRKAIKGKESFTNIHELRLSVISDIKLSKSDRKKYDKVVRDLDTSDKMRTNNPSQDGIMENIYLSKSSDAFGRNGGCRESKLVFLQNHSKTIHLQNQEESKKSTKFAEISECSKNEELNYKKINRNVNCVKRRWKSADVNKSVTLSHAASQQVSTKSISCPATRAGRRQAAFLHTMKNSSSPHNNQIAMEFSHPSSKQFSLHGLLVCKSVNSGLESRSALVAKIIEELFPQEDDDYHAITNAKKNQDATGKDVISNGKEITTNNVSTNTNLEFSPKKLNGNKKFVHKLSARSKKLHRTVNVKDKHRDSSSVHEEKPIEKKSAFTLQRSDKQNSSSELETCNTRKGMQVLQGIPLKAGNQCNTFTEHPSEEQWQTNDDKKLQVRLPQISDKKKCKKTIKLTLTSRERRRSPVRTRKAESKVEDNTESISPKEPIFSLVCMKKLFPNANLELY